SSPLDDNRFLIADSNFASTLFKVMGRHDYLYPSAQNLVFALVCTLTLKPSPPHPTLTHHLTHPRPHLQYSHSPSSSTLHRYIYPSASPSPSSVPPPSPSPSR